MPNPKPPALPAPTPEGISNLAELARASLKDSGEYRIVAALIVVERVHKPGLRSCPPPVESYEQTPSGSWKQVGS